MRMVFASPKRVRFLKKFALALPLNLFLAAVVFAITPIVLVGGVLCAAAGACMAYGFESALDTQGPAIETSFARSPGRQPAESVSFRHRHA